MTINSPSRVVEEGVGVAVGAVVAVGASVPVGVGEVVELDAVGAAGVAVAVVETADDDAAGVFAAEEGNDVDE